MYETAEQLYGEDLFDHFDVWDRLRDAGESRAAKKYWDDHPQLKAYMKFRDSQLLLIEARVGDIGRLLPEAAPPQFRGEIPEDFSDPNRELPYSAWADEQYLKYATGERDIREVINAETKKAAINLSPPLYRLYQDYARGEYLPPHILQMLQDAGIPINQPPSAETGVTGVSASSSQPPPYAPSLAQPPLDQHPTPGSAAEAIAQGRIPERRFRSLSPEASVARARYLFGVDIADRAIAELIVAGKVSKETLGMVVDKGIELGMQEDEAVLKFLRYIDPKTATKLEKEEIPVLTFEHAQELYSTEFGQLLRQTVFRSRRRGDENEALVGGFQIYRETQHGQKFFRLRPPYYGLVFQEEGGQRDGYIAVHEAAHAADQLGEGPGPNRTSNTAAFQAAADSVFKWTEDDYEGKPYAFAAYMLQHWPGLYGNPSNIIREGWTWGGYIELYAELLTVSFGDIDRIPPPLRKFYELWLR